MPKRLIMGLFALTALAVLWSASDTEAACYWKKLAAGWCYYCPCTSYSVSGTCVTPDQCIAFYPGSLGGTIIDKLLPTDINRCEGESCARAVIGVYGTYDRKGEYCWGEPVANQPCPLDDQCYVNVDVFCCPPGHTDPITGECLDPVDSEGNPGYSIGGDAISVDFTELNKRVSRAEFEIVFSGFCPNDGWYEESTPTGNFFTVTCTCPYGFSYDGGQWKCCYERRADGTCNSYAPPSDGLSIDEAAVVMYCQWPPLPTDDHNGCIGMEEESFPSCFPGIETGFCNDLYNRITPPPS